MKSKLTVIGLVFLSFLVPTLANASEIRPTNFVSFGITFDNPSSLATAPNGDIWVADWTTDRVYLFSMSATGNPTPLKVVSLYPSGGNSSNFTDASSIDVDSSGFLYVADASVNKIFVFNPSAGDNQFIGDATRTITLGRRARTIALDATGKIYAAGKYNGKLEVRIYAAGTTGTGSTPINSFIDTTINSGDEPYGLTVLPSGEVAVAWWVRNDIRIYTPDSDQVFTLSRTITGDNTGIGNNMVQLLSDSAGRLYIYNSGSNTIEIFAPLADGNVSPAAIIGLHAVTGGAPLAELVKYGWGMTLGHNSQIWLGDGNQFIVHFDNPFTIEDVVATVPSNVIDTIAIAKATAAAREREVTAAKAEISTILSSGKPLTLDQLKKAEIPGVTAKNVDLINSEIAQLSGDKKTDIKAVERVVFKYATVDKIAEHSTITSTDLISVGLIPEDSKNKTSILLELKKLPAGSIDTYEEIQAAVAAVEKRLADRKAKLATVLARSKR